MHKGHEYKTAGFMLVELLAVLVILAFLTVILVPFFTGFIDDARKKPAAAEAKVVYMAAQAAVTASYANDKESDNLKEQIVRLVGGSCFKGKNIGEIIRNDDDSQIKRIGYLRQKTKGKL